MMRLPSNAIRAIVLMILVAAVIPIALYWLGIGRAPSVSPEKAMAMLAEPGAGALLVDVRDKAAFDWGHLDGAVSWPYAELVERLLGPRDSAIPAEYRGKTLLLVCESGILSADATLRLRRAGAEGAFNVGGGMQAWVAASAGKPSGSALCRLRSAAGEVRDLPYRESPAIEQWAMLSTFWFVKPAYMMLSLFLVWVLRRATSPDLLALKWGLIFFFAGEAFCYANYFLFTDASHLFEYLHSFGMVLSFGFAIFALFEGMDLRLIKYSDPNQKCAALALCRACPKYADAPCGLKRLFMYMTPACAVMCFAPFAAPLQSVSYNSHVLWVAYNYSNPVVYQIFETRLAPLFALAFFAAAFAALLFGKESSVVWGKILFSAGAGYLGFGMFRLFLFGVYRDRLVWFTFWEEVTELLYIGAVAFTLRLFRRALLGLSPGGAE